MLFLIVKTMNQMMRKEAAEPADDELPPAPTKDQELLAEIRDLLSGRKLDMSLATPSAATDPSPVAQTKPKS